MTGEGVAVVGLACRYPDAPSPDALWHTVLTGRRAFRAMPGERLSSPYLGDGADQTYLRQAAVLEDWTFDRRRFQVPPHVHAACDPAHWLALETAAAALEDAGLGAGAGLERGRVGVIVGNSLTGEFSRSWQLRHRLPFLTRLVGDALRSAGADADLQGRTLAGITARMLDTFPEPNDETLAGALSNTIAGRICNHFDFGGGGYTVDGACASSLLAITTGCRLIATGEADVVLAGGVDLSLDPFELVGFARLGALASSDMRVYDAAPTGFLPGEGCGMVVLMRAADARARGLRPYAEVAGWGISSDGAGGITRPEVAGQVRAIAAAYAMAGLEPAEVALIEGHGTGTAVGDAVELAALNEVRGSAPAALGSVKANIGHTKAAAGAASFVKAVLAVHRRVLPPATGVQTPHPLLDPDVSGLTPLAEPAGWPAGRAHAGVTSAGFGGINAHVLVSGEPVASRGGVPARRSRTGGARTAASRVAGSRVAVSSDAARSDLVRSRIGRPRIGRSDWELVPLRAASADELGRQLTLVHEHAERWSHAELADVAATCAQDYSGLTGVRAVLLARTPDEAAAAAAKALTRLGDLRPGSAVPLIDDAAGFVLAAGRVPRIGLLFPGQAAPVRTGLSSWATGLPVPDFAPELQVQDGASDTAQAQPAVLRQSLAALAWLRRLGVRAEAAVGHSLGEIAALCWAGAIEPAAALALAEQRGRLMALHGGAGTGLTGVRADGATVAELLAGLEVGIACHNGPLQTVVGGPLAVLADLQARARDRGITCTPLPVSHAFHTPAMQPVVAPLARCVQDVRWSTLSGTVISTVTGAALRDGEDLATLLARQLLEPVAFGTALQQLADRCDLLVEAGPGSTLRGLAAECVELPVVSCDAGGSERTAAVTAATLAAAGCADLRDWRGRRWFRPRRLDRESRFLVSPCEAGTEPGPSSLGVPAYSSPAEPAGTVGADSPAAGSAGAVSAGASSAGAGSSAAGTSMAATPAAGSVGSRPAADTDVLTELRMLFAERADVAPDTLDSGSSPLRDLHLSSLEVRRCIATVCGRRQVATPDAALSLSDATLGQIAEVVGELPGLGAADATAQVAGVRRWLGLFGHHWQAWQPGNRRKPGVQVRVLDLTSTTGLAELATRLPDALGQPGTPLLLRHAGHPAAPALGRNLALELPGTPVTVLDESAGHWPGAPAELATPDGYAELRVTASGTLERRVTQRRDGGRTAQLRFADNDILLVTGGAGGLTARCAAELAMRSGGRLVLLGRTPARDAGVVESLATLRATGARADYRQCDITDEKSVRTVLSSLRAGGTIAALLHGAAVNEPRLLPAVTAESLTAAWAPKVDGARLLLAEAADTLRLVVGFGSIIGCFGLVGETDYAVANDGLRVLLEDWADAHPDVRVRVAEWSVWADVGMGARMQVLDDLRRAGIDPIRPAEGISAFLDLVDEVDAPVTTLVTGRFPATVTAVLTAPEPAAEHAGRFAEEVLASTPGVELVTDSRLSYGDDPYLADHEIDGAGVLPAVLSLEAFAQLAGNLGLPPGPVGFEDLRLTAPIDVPRTGSAVLRTAALRVTGGPGAAGLRVEASTRCDADGFASDRVVGHVYPAGPLGTAAPVPVPAGLDPDRPHPLYDSTLFHRGGLRRISRFDLLSAYRVRAWVRADRTAKWFSSFHSGRIRLWDPGLLDASLQVLLPTVPGRLALPVACQRLEVAEPADGWLLVEAVERSHTQDEFLFDVTVRTEAGDLVCRWSGLRLRAVSDRDFPAGMPLELAGPWLSRRAEDAGLGRFDIVSCPGRRADGAAQQVLSALAGGPVGHDPQGRPISPAGQLSASYAGDAVLAGFGAGALGLDWQRPQDVAEADWPACLSTADRTLLDSADFDQSESVLATRLWCAHEAVRKATGGDGPLRLSDAVSADGDWLFESGTARVLTTRVQVAGLGDVVCGLAVPSSSP